MIEIKAPNVISGKNTLFLAGSIEMGSAKDWQSEVVELLKDENITILNPRRSGWDSSWEQKINNPKFKKQVEWELSAQEKADRILMYFNPETKAPISLLELGLFAKSNKLIVCCPEGFYRKGNVDIVCEKYSIPRIEKLSEIMNFLPHS